MNASFRSFAIGLTLSFLPLYLILVAPFRSFLDPFIIMLAVGYRSFLWGTTPNVMSLMDVAMLAGVVLICTESSHYLKIWWRITDALGPSEKNRGGQPVPCQPKSSRHRLATASERLSPDGSAEISFAPSSCQVQKTG
jgi:hypothetical protein